MNQDQINEILQQGENHPTNVEFVGFPTDPNRGWYHGATGEETRMESERRAAKFYMWLCEHLDQELKAESPAVFDAGVQVPEEEGECEHDKIAPRHRCRHTTLLIGHGDFMSLVLKRIIAGFGHAVENDGIPHRSAMVHNNTGTTSLEYFGNGRWLVMGMNQTPHFAPEEYAKLRTGGSLKDGWSYLVPNDEFILDAEVSVAFLDEHDDHVLEQTEALKALYLSSADSDNLHIDKTLSVEKDEKLKLFVVKRGLQVVGVATYSEQTGRLTDVAIRPSAGNIASETLLNSVKNYSRKLGRSGSLLIEPRSDETKKMFESMGFVEANDSNAENKANILKLDH
jgi:hypothetical protein